MWKDLSIQDKTKLIGLYYKNGMNSILEMREHYNTFEKGGKVDGLNQYSSKSYYQDTPDLSENTMQQLNKSFGLEPIDKDRIERIIGKLKKANWNNKQIAAYIGSTTVESGVNPERQQYKGPGYGIIQANPGRKLARQLYPGLSPEEKQINYDIDVMNGKINSVDEWNHGGVGSGFQKARHAKKAFLNPTSTLDQVEHAFTRGFEQPNSDSAKYNQRRKNAHILYKELTNLPYSKK